MMRSAASKLAAHPSGAQPMPHQFVLVVPTAAMPVIFAGLGKLPGEQMYHLAKDLERQTDDQIRQAVDAAKAAAEAPPPPPPAPVPPAQAPEQPAPGPAPATADPQQVE